MTRRTRGEHFTTVLANRTELLVLFPFNFNAFNYIICSIWSQGPPKNSFENIIFQNSMNCHRHSRKWVQVVGGLLRLTSLYVYSGVRWSSREHWFCVYLYSETTVWEQKQQSWKKFTQKNLGVGLISFPTTFSPSLGMVTITA